MTSRKRSPRFWAWSFSLAGAYALACIPAVFVFEHFRWSEYPLHVTSFAAAVLCAASAGMYLFAARGTAPVVGRARLPVRPLAYAALAVAGGFVLLCVVLAVRLAFYPPDF